MESNQRRRCCSIWRASAWCLVSWTSTELLFGSSLYDEPTVSHRTGGPTCLLGPRKGLPTSWKNKGHHEIKWITFLPLLGLQLSVWWEGCFYLLTYSLQSFLPLVIPPSRHLYLQTSLPNSHSSKSSPRYPSEPSIRQLIDRRRLVWWQVRWSDPVSTTVTPFSMEHPPRTSGSCSESSTRSQGWFLGQGEAITSPRFWLDCTGSPSRHGLHSRSHS